MSVSTIPAKQLPELIRNGGKVIDVRSPSEYNSVHVEGAELHPLDQLDPDAFCREHGEEQCVYILCQSGKRGEMAARKLAAAGHRNAIVVEGGTQAAIKAGLSVIRGKGTISLERQVRIAAGLLVLFGTLAGVFIHSALFLIPGFVGAGLAFAGITDTCGMGMLLAKCPWNR